MSIDLDPLEVEGLVEPSEGRGRRRRASTVDLEPMAIEGVVEPAHEIAESRNKSIGKAVSPVPGMGDRIMQWLDSGNGTYMGGFSPEAAASGIADVLTFDHADELMGAVRSGSVSGPGYEEHRDRYRRRRARDQEGHEGSVAVGALGGVAATLPAFAATLPARAGTAARLGTAAAEGLGIGALSGMGRSEAEGVDLAKDTVEGGLEGAAFSGIVGGGVEALRGLGGRVADFARSGARQRLRQAGAERTPEIRRIEARGDPEVIARELRGAGVFGPMGMSSTGAVQERVGGMREAAMGTLEQTRATMAGSTANVSGVADALEEPLRDLGTGGTARPLREQLRAWISEYRNAGELPFEELDRRRRQVGDMLNVEARNPSGREGILRKLYGALAETQQQAVARTSPEMGTAYQQARRHAELGMAFEDVYENAEQRGAARSAGGLYDMFGIGGGGAMGAMLGDALGAGGGAMLGLGAARAMQSPRARAVANETLAALGRRAPSAASQPTLDALRRAGTMGAVRAMGPDAEPPVEAMGPDPFAEDTSPLMVGGDESLPPEIEALFGDEGDELPPEIEALFQGEP